MCFNLTTARLSAVLRCGSKATFWAVFLSKFVLCMRMNCYFRASDQNSDTAIGFGNPDFLYVTDILAIDGH